MARPSEFSQEIADAICEQLAEGESLRAICVDDDMPSRESVRRWLEANEAFRGQYARAREAQADHYAEQVIAIADETHTLFEGVPVPVDHNRARLQIDARKWAASKLAPKRYGDKVQNEHSGPDGQPIAIERIERVVVRPSNPDR